jgi:hypothetical protein
MRGTDPRPRCRMHLGRRREDIHQETALERQARSAYEEARRHGVPPDVDPLSGLLEVFRDALLWKRVCGSILGDLESVRYRAGAGEQVRGEVILWERALERVARIAVDLLRVGVEERLKLVSREQTALITSAMHAALVELAPQLALDPASPDVRAVIGRHLRKVARDDG